MQSSYLIYNSQFLWVRNVMQRETYCEEGGKHLTFLLNLAGWDMHVTSKAEPSLVNEIAETGVTTAWLAGFSPLHTYA